MSEAAAADANTAAGGGPIRRLLLGPFERTVDALEPIVTADRPLAPVLLLGLSVWVSWHVYVPIHELLHVAGCVGTGGTVTTLELQEQYGGAVLARWLPFVQPGGDYPGRLSGFDTHGSDAVYLATDALPFVLSLLAGPLLLRLAARGCRPLLAGPAAVLGLAPFYNLPGDYFEMGGILVTSALGARWQAIRSDDAFSLVAELWQSPARLGLQPGDGTLAPLLVLAAALLGAALAYATWALGDALAKRLLHEGARGA